MTAAVPVQGSLRTNECAFCCCSSTVPTSAAAVSQAWGKVINTPVPLSGIVTATAGQPKAPHHSCLAAHPTAPAVSAPHSDPTPPTTARSLHNTSRSYHQNHSVMAWPMASFSHNAAQMGTCAACCASLECRAALLIISTGPASARGCLHY